MEHGNFQRGAGALRRGGSRLIAPLLALVLLGCATAPPRPPGCLPELHPAAPEVKTGGGITQMGQPFNLDGVNGLQPGFSTEADATLALGPPARSSRTGDGQDLLEWVYVYADTKGTKTGAQVAISFSRECRMIRIVGGWRPPPQQGH